MGGISEKIVDSMAESKIILAEDKELYVYGFHQGFIIIVNILTTIAIGLAFGMIWESIVFSLAYIPLRTYAGGYHSKTQFRCYLFSIVIITAVLLTIKLLPWTGFICEIIALCAGLVITFFAPVEDKNKPLDQIEKAVYKKRTYIILGVFLLIALTCWLIGYSFISISISMALFVLAIMLVLGKVKNVFSTSKMC